MEDQNPECDEATINGIPVSQINAMPERIRELESQVAELQQYKLRCAQQDLQALLDRYGLQLVPTTALQLVPR